MKKILLLVSLAFVSLLVCANPEDDRGVPMRAQGACPPVHTIAGSVSQPNKMIVFVGLSGFLPAFACNYQGFFVSLPRISK